MKLTITLSLVLLISFLNGNSQNQKYIVKDSQTNVQIEFSGINFLNNTGIYTDAKGEFYADATKTPTIIVSHLSYEEKKVDLNNTDSIIYLTPKLISINEIVVESNKLKKQYIDINTSNKKTKNFAGFGTYGYQLAVLIKPSDTSKKYYLDQISIPIKEDQIWMRINNVKKIPNALVRINFCKNLNNEPSDSLLNYSEYVLLNKKTYKRTSLDHKLNTKISVPKEGLFCIFTLLGKTDDSGNLIVEKPTYKRNHHGEEIIFMKYLPIQIPLEDDKQTSFSRSYFNKENSSYCNISPSFSVPINLASEERDSFIKEKRNELDNFKVPIRYKLYFYE